jgi:Cupin superfamily protein
MTSASQPMGFDLAALIAPCWTEDFFREYWGQKPLHVSRGKADYFKPLLTKDDLETIIASTDMRYPAIQLARNGGYFPAEAYTRNVKHGGEFFNGEPDLARVQAEYRTGATVVLPALHRTWVPLKETCAALETEFCHAAHANAYLTPGDSTGFTPHYDTHDVFVAQIAGYKHWRIFEPPLRMPHRSQPFTPAGYALPAPCLELDLNPGDVLYLPRGYVHAASTSKSHSAHVTIGMTVYTWVELMSELAASSVHLASFRAALPPGFARREDLKPMLREGLIERLEQLRQTGDYDRLIETFLQKVRSGRPHSGGSFEADVRVIGLESKLKAPDPGRYRISVEKGGTVLEFAGRKIFLPGHVLATLDDMCKRPSFRPGELAGRLDNDGKLGLARYLHQERFLTLAD